MGCYQSNLVPMPDGFDYMAISIKENDKVILIYATTYEVNIVREAIKQSWTKGIQQERSLLGNAHEFKLHGNPFHAQTSFEDAIMTRKLGCHILLRLHNIGCKLLLSSNLSREADLTTWIFHREETPQTQFDFGCVWLSSTGMLQIVNFPVSMHQMFQDIVQRYLPYTPQKVVTLGDTLEVRMYGNPWTSADGAKSVESNTLIKALINELDAQRWVLYGSSNIGGGADSLFFRYEPNLPVDGSRMAVFSMALNKTDCLRLVDGPPEAINGLKSALLEFWEGGVKEEMQELNVYEVQLAGNPWQADGAMEVNSRYLVCKILERLMSIGWRAQIAITLSANPSDMSVLTFEHAPAMELPIFCLSLNKKDRIRIINAPSDTLEALRSLIRTVWTFGVLLELTNGTSVDFKLIRNPWGLSSDVHDGAHGRVLLLHLLKLCARLGWFVILSANVSAKHAYRDNGAAYPIDVDSWWFMRIRRPPRPPPSISFLEDLFSTQEHNQENIATAVGPTESFADRPPPYSEFSE